MHDSVKIVGGLQTVDLGDEQLLLHIAVSHQRYVFHSRGVIQKLQRK